MTQGGVLKSIEECPSTRPEVLFYKQEVVFISGIIHPGDLWEVSINSGGNPEVN